METPIHEHDCDECTYLGTVAPAPCDLPCNGVDLYIHATGSQRSCIRRSGSNGPDYCSMPLDFALNRDTGGDYAEIVKRARARNLI